MTQTAVQWLMEELWNNKHLKVFPTAEYQQAKQMEKGQIIDTWIQATPRNIPKYEAITKEFAERYYTETYNK
jgi:hypothetical protein